MFSKSAEYYDEIYVSMGKDYSKEAAKIHKIIQKNLKAKGRTLLDVGCGTGHHIQFLNQHYHIEGLDLDKKMLNLAQKKYPKMRFYQKDMIDFDLNKKFNVVISMFSSIGYVKTKKNLNKAIQTMSHHLMAGGVLLIEPWFSPDQWRVGNVFTAHVNKPELKITRMSYSSKKRNISILDFQYLVGTPKGVHHWVEKHELGLFYKEDYIQGFEKAGLKVRYDEKGVNDRGLYVGIKQ